MQCYNADFGTKPERVFKLKKSHESVGIVYPIEGARLICSINFYCFLYANRLNSGLIYELFDFRSTSYFVLSYNWIVMKYKMLQKSEHKVHLKPSYVLSKNGNWKLGQQLHAWHNKWWLTSWWFDCYVHKWLELKPNRLDTFNYILAFHSLVQICWVECNQFINFTRNKPEVQKLGIHYFGHAIPPLWNQYEATNPVQQPFPFNGIIDDLKETHNICSNLPELFLQIVISIGSWSPGRTVINFKGNEKVTERVINCNRSTLNK